MTRPPAQGHGLSIWLLPTEGNRTPFTRMIADLAARHGGPVFEPHVTLLSGVSLDEEVASERAAALAAQLAPLQLGLADLATDDAYFRALHVEVILDGPLRAARQAAESGFETEPALLDPHLSLLYGWLDRGVQQSELMRLSGLTGVRMKAVVFDQLELHRTLGPTEDWTTLGRWSLGG